MQRKIRERPKAILYIDTSNNKKTEVVLTSDGKKQEFSQTSNSWTSQNLLPLIQKVFIQKHLTLKDVTEIHVNVGPGSYTGLRVGIAVANTLGWLLEVPVNGKKRSVVDLRYS